VSTRLQAGLRCGVFVARAASMQQADLKLLHDDATPQHVRDPAIVDKPIRFVEAATTMAGVAPCDSFVHRIR
jgi:hypothetical protein